MSREDWRDERERRRDEPARGRDDFGQADYSDHYAYDPRTRSGYRADDYAQPNDSASRPYDPEPVGPYRRSAAPDRGGYEPPSGPRSWMDRAGEFLGGGPRYDDPPRDAVRDAAPPRRRGPSDRVLWAVIMERLDDDRRLDLRHVEVIVDNAEVTLNGSVRHKGDKRRIEDIVDIDGVRHVQNNLRLRDRERGWTFL
jgi:hypothetical protein